MALDRADKLRELDRAAAAAVWLRADSVVVDREDWVQVTTRSVKRHSHNRVIESVLTTEQASACVAQVVAEYAAFSCDFSWRVGPRARPSHLCDLLEQHRMTRNDVIGMAADVDGLVISEVPGIVVELVDVDSIGDYVAACAAGWKLSSTATIDMRADMDRAFADGNQARSYYVARCNQTPVGAGALVRVSDRSGYLVGSSVVPEHRNRGVYRALVAARVAALRADGIPLVTIQAVADTSARICARLGFETLCGTRIYVSVPFA